jgi:hypothetical protein
VGVTFSSVWLKGWLPEESSVIIVTFRFQHQKSWSQPNEIFLPWRLRIMECKDFHLRLKQRFNVSVKCLILMTLMMPTVEAKLRLLAAREVVGGQFTTGIRKARLASTMPNHSATASW